MKSFKRITAFLMACAMLGVGNTLSYSGDNVWAVDSEDVKAVDNGDDEVYSGKCGVDVYWELSDGVLEIYGTGDMSNFYYSNAPWNVHRKIIYEVIIHEGVTSIGDSAFYERTSLASVTIPNSVSSIGSTAFCECTSLTSITIPDSVSSIGFNAFNGCTSLTNITIPDSVSSIGDSAFIGTPWLEEQRKKSPFVIINNILVDATTYEGDITIPDDISSIADGAFFDCKSLTSITIPNGISSISNSAFESCGSLSNITILDGVSSIRNNAFYECTSLTSITIPDSVSSIGYSAFSGCVNLENVYYTGTEEQWRNETRIKKGNSPLTSATIHYNDNVYEEPTEDQMVFLKFIVQKIQRISELLVNLIDQNTIFGVIKYFFQTKL